MEEKVEQEVSVVVEEESTIEVLQFDSSYDRNELYIPTEYQIIDYQNSWKKCHCGRVTRFNDRFCPSCGQHLGRPELN